MSNRKFLVLRRNDASPQAAEKASPPSPEEMQKMFAAYKAWMDKYKDSIVDPGDRLLSGGKILSSTGVADGPFVEAKEVVAGYMILSTETYEEAVEIMKAGPAGQVQTGSFEIRELAGAEM